MRPISFRSRGLRRALSSGIVAATAIGMLGIAAIPAAADPAADRTVVSGQARFEVLSPTLIRTEYAGDSQFTDGSTFNVIGRDDFAPTTFTKTERDGWLTLDTGAMTVRYKEGSGAFTQDTLQTTVTTASGQRVTGTPWVSTPDPLVHDRVALRGRGARTHRPVPRDGPCGLHRSRVRRGLRVRRQRDDLHDHGGACRLVRPGPALRELAGRRRPGRHPHPQRDRRRRRREDVRLAPGANWDDWKTTAATTLDLTAGEHRVRIERTADDSGRVNVDSLALVSTGAAYPAPSTTVTGEDCAFGTVCQAEDAARTAPATTATNHNGFAGDGFVAGFERAGAQLTTHVTGVPAAGDYALQVRYANGSAGAPTLTAAPTGQQASTAPLPRTSGWDYWNTATVPVHLAAGTNDVVIGCPTLANNCNVNFDTVAVVGTASPVLAAHAPLGGYRRDLDTADGSVKTNPGLLYQDGWSLLDDSASALYDQATDTVTPAGDHGGERYQDGYVFGYGSDYRHALEELAVLTGPTKLLPRWAYGVWYSEYYDRSQADYLAIAKRFDDEDVPVDVMAIDTDYKIGSPTNQGDSKWNGWSVDPSRIPDMTGLLGRLARRGHPQHPQHPPVDLEPGPAVREGPDHREGQTHQGRRRPVPVRLVRPRPAQGVLRPAHLAAAEGRRHVVARLVLQRELEVLRERCHPRRVHQPAVRGVHRPGTRRPGARVLAGVRLADGRWLRQPAGGPDRPVGGQAHDRALHRRHHVVVGHAARRGRLHPR